MYTSENFKTKKELKKAIKAGKWITCFEPGIGKAQSEGRVWLEGPHYPAPHTWYAQAELLNGRIVSVK